MSHALGERAPGTVEASEVLDPPLAAPPEFARLPQLIDPDAYRRAVQEAEERATLHSSDVDALVDLADLHSLRSIGGPAAPWKLLKGLMPAFDADAALRSLERAEQIEPGSPTIAARLRDTRVHASPAILLAALPKSGSVFVFHGLTTGTGKGRVSGVQAGAFPNFTVCQPGMMTLTSYRLATHTHLAPSRTNLIELGARFKLDRMLVHVRDPRQALVSWFYFMPSVLGDLDPSQRLHYGVPEDYLSWPQARQLDWQIGRFLPWFVEWIEGWLDAPLQPWFGTRILYTTFEDMVTDTRAFFERILDFYEIDRECFICPEKPRVHGDRNFRRGDVDEWRSLLSSDQIERASSVIPPRLFDRFGWPRR